MKDFFKRVAGILGLTCVLGFLVPASFAQSNHPHTPANKPAKVQVVNGVQVVRVTVTPMGYNPSSLQLKPGVKTRLIFTRTEDGGCADTIHLPGFGIKKTALPLNKPVQIEFTPSKAGTYAFACGMNMLKGTILVGS